MRFKIKQALTPGSQSEITFLEAVLISSRLFQHAQSVQLVSHFLYQTGQLN